MHPSLASGSKRFAAAVAATLVGASLTACGGPPTDASEKEFCGAYLGFFEAAGAGDDDAVLAAIDTALEDMKAVGTPADLSDEEREGFEVFLDLLEDLDAEDIAAERNGEKDLGDDLSDAEEKKVDAFIDYGYATCDFSDFPGLAPPEPVEVTPPSLEE